MSAASSHPQPGRLPVLVEADEIARCVRALAAQIIRDHGTDEGLVIVAVLKGVVIFLADLVRCLPMPRPNVYTGLLCVQFPLGGVNDQKRQCRCHRCTRQHPQD